MKVNFVLCATHHGTLLVNRNDYHPQHGFGVGKQLFETGAYDFHELRAIAGVLSILKEHRGTGVVALDVGANIGACTVPWARHLEGWGEVHAFEAQEQVFYALCGNLCLNNLSNAHARHCAVGAGPGVLDIPVLDVGQPASFGSLELKPAMGEDIGQKVDYVHTTKVEQVALDPLFPGRVDFMKIDVEGMELEVFNGAAGIIERERPVIYYEHIKIDQAACRSFLTMRGYALHPNGMNTLAIPPGMNIKIQ